ncbi:hypothetical protein [Butyrivibrio sp. CB08]|uniref:hypothetical protein n=1 Tax=Butyrivibrio sp. CB08 TaxID=2364879 RepID=UPI001313F90F|nr:hypothetical protein [Butyrivibrio sp. CB08]
MASKKTVCKKRNTPKPQCTDKNPFSVSLNFGFKVLKCQIDISLDEDYLERRRNETVRSKCGNNAGNRHS